MKYKEFRVKTHNKHLNKACIKHAKAIGGSHYDGDKKFRGELYFNLYGDFTVVVSGISDNPEITLDEFFSLTSETVKVKSEPKLRTHLIIEALTDDEVADVEHLINKIKEEREL